MDRDLNLVNKAKSGDQKAFTALMNRHRERLYYFIFTMLKNVYDTEDIMMISFNSAFMSINKFKPDFLFKTWLYSIAKNNCIDFIRKRKIEIVSYDNDLKYVLNMESENLNPDELLISKQTMEVYNKNLDKLSDYQRDLIEMRYYFNCSYKDLAEIKKVNVATIGSHLNRITALLNKISKGKLSA
jgi:RNA polymerase sigma factor (sigma-70 family)